MGKGNETKTTTRDVSDWSDFLVGSKTSESKTTRGNDSETSRASGPTKASADSKSRSQAIDKLNNKR